ncbi:MAG: hypothetical protein ACLPSF_08820 [Methylocella sp.]
MDEKQRELIALYLHRLQRLFDHGMGGCCGVIESAAIDRNVPACLVAKPVGPSLSEQIEEGLSRSALPVRISKPAA